MRSDLLRYLPPLIRSNTPSFLSERGRTLRGKSLTKTLLTKLGESLMPYWGQYVYWVWIPGFVMKKFKDSFRREKAERKINKKKLLRFQTSWRFWATVGQSTRSNIDWGYLFLALQEIYNPLFVYHGNWRTQTQWLKTCDYSCKTKIVQHSDNSLLSWSLI